MPQSANDQVEPDVVDWRPGTFWLVSMPQSANDQVEPLAEDRRVYLLMSFNASVGKRSSGTSPRTV